MPDRPSSLTRRRRAPKEPVEQPDINFVDAERVYDVGELLSMIASYIDWYTLMKLSRSGQGGRKAAQYETRVRLRILLGPYLEASHFPGFLDILDRTKGLVCGSIARQLLSTQSSNDILVMPNRPFDLNLVVTKSGSKKCMKFFMDIGFSAFASDTVGPAYLGSVQSFQKAVKSVAGVVVSRLIFPIYPLTDCFLFLDFRHYQRRPDIAAARPSSFPPFRPNQRSVVDQSLFLLPEHHQLSLQRSRRRLDSRICSPQPELQSPAVEQLLESTLRSPVRNADSQNVGRQRCL